MKAIESHTHDACITWRAGNGTILLQNVVRKDEECITSRISFWRNFINMYYRGSGSNVICCEGDGCNNGAHRHTHRKGENIPPGRQKFVLPGISDLTKNKNNGNIQWKWYKNFMSNFYLINLIVL